MPGPTKDRSCTDVLCLLVFVAFLIGWGVVGYFGKWNFVDFTEKNSVKATGLPEGYTVKGRKNNDSYIVDSTKKNQQIPFRNPVAKKKWFEKKKYRRLDQKKHGKSRRETSSMGNIVDLPRKPRKKLIQTYDKVTILLLTIKSGNTLQEQTVWKYCWRPPLARKKNSEKLGTEKRHRSIKLRALGTADHPVESRRLEIANCFWTAKMMGRFVRVDGLPGAAPDEQFLALSIVSLHLVLGFSVANSLNEPFSSDFFVVFVGLFLATDFTTLVAIRNVRSVDATVGSRQICSRVLRGSATIYRVARFGRREGGRGGGSFLRHLPSFMAALCRELRPSVKWERLSDSRHARADVRYCASIAKDYSRHIPCGRFQWFAGHRLSVPEISTKSPLHLSARCDIFTILFNAL